LVHRSPRTWQPDAGWQTLAVPVPNGAQYELQQPPQPSQVSPSTRQGVLRFAQVPAVAPAAMVQTPVQHSLLWKQMSPGWVQYETLDGASQIIVVGLHLPLQHCESCVQALPAVEQVALSGLQLPLTHCVLQQASPPAVHGWLSETHLLALHVPPVQFKLQQSVGLTQLTPAVAQAATVQMFMVGSHVPEQHSEFMAQALPPVKQPPSPGMTSAERSSPSMPSMSSVAAALLWQPHPGVRPPSESTVKARR
jgi:hypothetical protein